MFPGLMQSVKYQWFVLVKDQVLINWLEKLHIIWHISSVLGNLDTMKFLEYHQLYSSSLIIVFEIYACKMRICHLCDFIKFFYLLRRFFFPFLYNLSVPDELTGAQETPLNDRQQKVRYLFKGASSQTKRPLSTSNRRLSLNTSNRKLRSRTRSEGQLKNLGTKDANDSMEWLRPASAFEKEADTKACDTSFGYDYADLDSSFTKFLQVFIEKF